MQVIWHLSLHEFAVQIQLISFSEIFQVVILAVLIAVAIAADVYPPKPYPTPAYSKDYDYVSFCKMLLCHIQN